MFRLGFAQEKLMPYLPAEDSIMAETESKLLYNGLISGALPSDEIVKSFDLPEFNIDYEMAKRWNYNIYEQDITNNNIFKTEGKEFINYPFLRNVTILNGAAYKVSDNFLIGGNSYGGRSIFTSPFPGQNFNNFDFRGSSLFMQYNVSKNFKIETHINVTRSYKF